MLRNLRQFALVMILAVNVSGTFAQDVIVDNVDPGFAILSGSWTLTSFSANRYGADYRFANDTGSNLDLPTAQVSWTPNLPTAGMYNVYLFYPNGGNRATNAPFTISTSWGSTTVTVNQQTNGGVFNHIGRFNFPAGTGTSVILGNNAGPNVVIADAMRFELDTTTPLRQEIRAFWVSRFMWPSANQSVAITNIDNTMQKATQFNFNTVMFQIRGQMDTHYPSPYEPWSNVYNWTNPGWDPLDYAVTKAHSHGLELYAYFNTHTMSSPPPLAVTVPQHVYNLHGPGAPAGSTRWDVEDSTGFKLASNGTGDDDGYVWLSPGVPEASFRTRREVMHLVQNYDIDGLHFDRIRTPEHDLSYDTISVSRFNGDGNPDGLSYPDFMQSQIERDLRNIYGGIQYYKPAVKLSSSPIGISKRDSTTQYQGTGNAAQYNYNQNAMRWLQAHVMDFVIPQIYWEIDSTQPHEKLLADWLANAGGRWLVPGSRCRNTVAGTGYKPIASASASYSSLTGEYLQSRLQNAAGHCVWNRDELDVVPPSGTVSYFTGLKNTWYDQPTSAPAMPWKTSPTTGFITGYVLDESGNPVVDARLKRVGDDYTYLTAWDGFFSIVDVSPGSHEIKVTSTGLGMARMSGINVTAGAVTSVTLNLDPSRGFAEFRRTNYPFSGAAQVRVFDADLAASPSLAVVVKSGWEPAGEQVTLASSGGGLFTGSIALDSVPPLAANGVLSVAPSTSSSVSAITVTYADADDGGGTSATIVGTAKIQIPPDVFVESRLPNGPITPSPEYAETIGTWADTGAVNPNSICVKSMAPGLGGLGGRYSGTVGASARFRPNLSVPGLYNVYVTLPNATRGSGNHSPGAGFRVVHDGIDVTGTFGLSPTSNPAIADQWYLVASNVQFLAGTSGYVELTNNNAGSNTTTQRFSADAVRFEFADPLDFVPVRLSELAIE